MFVPEQARRYLTELGRPYRESDLLLIWELQRRAEEAAEVGTNNLIFCDTGPEVIRIWSEVKYGQCDSVIRRASETRHYDLTLLCYPDIEWVPDPLREAPELKDRLDLFGRYRELLPNAHVIRGTDRMGSALSALRSTMR